MLKKRDDFQNRKNLEELLMQKDNIDYLEFIISKDVTLFQDVLDKKDSWRKGPKVRAKHHLKGLFDEVAPAVNNYLGMAPASDPNLSLGSLGALRTTWYWHLPFAYVWGTRAIQIAAFLPMVAAVGGPLGAAMFALPHMLLGYIYYRLVTRNQDFYYPGGKRINLSKRMEEEVKVILSHEYTHFLQHAAGISSRILGEGHARGVERKMAEMYTLNKTNQVYMVGTLTRSTSELKTEYEYLCKKLGVKKADWIRKVRVRKSRSWLGGPSHYAKGVSLFRIAEEKFPGHNIYAEVLRQDFSHLKI